jgi:hypothetical protein
MVRALRVFVAGLGVAATATAATAAVAIGGPAPATGAAATPGDRPVAPDERPASPGTGATTATPAVRGGLREAAPRPLAEVRVQNRFARNGGTLQLFGGVDYLERRDFYVSPGVRLGATYFVWDSLGVELQVSHYFSRLNQAGLQVERMIGVVPDSRAPTWLVVGGARYAMGYGKMMIGGVGRAIHFEPQALVQAGIHVHDGSFGPSGLAGVGLLVHATPRWFVRLDGGMTVEIERRVTGTVTVLGFLPALVTGGVF